MQQITHILLVIIDGDIILQIAEIKFVLPYSGLRIKAVTDTQQTRQFSKPDIQRKGKGLRFSAVPAQRSGANLTAGLGGYWVIAISLEPIRATNKFYFVRNGTQRSSYQIQACPCEPLRGCV